ncbi:unnamed protein product [Cochlearia groenlandica]
MTMTTVLLLLSLVFESLLIILGFAIILILCYLVRRKNKDTILFKGFNETLDLKFLEVAPKEFLGRGTFGTTSKVALEDGTFVVSKRLKAGWMRKNDFEARMDIVRGIKHENLVDLRAYCSSESETCLFYDYIENSSCVSHLLYGKNNDEDRIPLDFQTRMMIAIGAAKGIAWIHKQNKGTMVHGNIKSSNIFINSKGQGCVSECGLAAAMSPVTLPIASETGYRAPEVFDTGVATQMADVYSFGIVLLELLTGKAAVFSISPTEKQSLAQWVHSELEKDWTVDLLDPCRQRSIATEPIMHALLKNALACVHHQPHQRPKIDDIVAVMEEYLTQS